MRTAIPVSTHNSKVLKRTHDRLLVLTVGPRIPGTAARPPRMGGNHDAGRVGSGGNIAVAIVGAFLQHAWATPSRRIVTADGLRSGYEVEGEGEVNGRMHVLLAVMCNVFALLRVGEGLCGWV